MSSTQAPAATSSRAVRRGRLGHPRSGNNVLKAGRGADTVNYLAHSRLLSTSAHAPAAGRAPVTPTRSTASSAWSALADIPARRRGATCSAAGEATTSSTAAAVTTCSTAARATTDIDVRAGRTPPTAGPRSSTWSPTPDSTIKCERLLFPGMPPSDGGRQRAAERRHAAAPRSSGRIRFRRGCSATRCPRRGRCESPSGAARAGSAGSRPRPMAARRRANWRPVGPRPGRYHATL